MKKKSKSKQKRTIVPLSKNNIGKQARIPKKSYPGGYYLDSVSKYHN